jgi:hypothetical protein
MNKLWNWIDANGLEVLLVQVWIAWMTYRRYGIAAVMSEQTYRGGHAGIGRGSRKRTFGASSPTHDGLPNLGVTLMFARSNRPAFTPFPSVTPNYDRRVLTA